MKALNKLLIVCLFGFFSACNGQAKTEKTPEESIAENSKKQSKKPMNLIDEQTKILGGMFSILDSGNEDNPFTDSKNYLEVVDKMNAPEETKNYLREQYKLYNMSLDPKKKDSLELMVDKMLGDLMSKGQEGLNNNN